MLDRWAACGEDDAWWLVGTSIRSDQNGPARQVRHDPDHPDLNQRGSRANTNGGTRDRIVELRDREMAMSVAYENVGARCMAIQVHGRDEVTPGAAD